MEHSLHSGEVTARILLYLGVFILLGTGFFARWIGPELAKSRPAPLRVLRLGGALLIATGSLYLVLQIVQLLGGPTWETALRYFTQTQQGELLLVRLALVAVVLVLELGNPFRLERVAFALVGLGILATLSLTAHAGAQGGLALPSHLVHTAVVVAWGGSLLVLSLLWEGHAELLPAVMRLSRLGAAAVVAFVLSGSLLALLHLSDGFTLGLSGTRANLVASAYGAALLHKLLGVAATLGIAALNRWWLLPAVRSGRHEGLGWMLQLEALLLLGVLVLTGFLATTSPPR